MAVAFTGYRITDADALSPTTPVAGMWEDTGGAAGVLEDNFFYQGTYSVADTVKTTELGTCFIPTSATYNASGSLLNFLLKGLISTSGLLATTRATGQKFEIGSGATAGSGRPTNYLQYYTNTLSTYPPLGGWIIHNFDVNQLAFIDNHVGGSTSKTAINYWGHVGTMTSTAVKAPNVSMDAIEYIAVGSGLAWTGAGGTFEAFVTFDENTVANRYGIVTTKDRVLHVLAMLTIGSAAQVTFTDSNRKLVFPWTYVGAGALGMAIDLQAASSAVDLTVCSFTGNGQSKVKQFFDTALEVNGATEQITVLAHGWSTGDYVQYNKEGGTVLSGLTDLTYYWVNVVSVDVVTLHTSRAAAYAGTGAVGITAASAPGENHSITRNPDNRIDFTVTGTTGTLALNSCILEGIRVLTLTSTCTLDKGFIQNIGNVVASTAALDGVVISAATLEEGTALFTPLASMNGIVRCNFTYNERGHAIEITSTGDTDSDANEFNGYWQPTISGSNYGWQFHTITGVDATNEIITTNEAHGFSTGNAVYYNKHGGTDSIGLTNLAKYYVSVLSTTTFKLHVTKAAAVAGSSVIGLTDGATGETHAIYGAHAAVYNNSAGDVTINVLNLGDTPSVRNGSGCTTTVVNTKTLKVTCRNTAGLGILGVKVRIEKQSDNSLVSEGTTLSTGVYQDTSYSYTGEVPVNVIARLKGFKDQRAQDDITVNGLSVPFTMPRDPAVDLP